MTTDTVIRLWTIQTPLAWSLLQQHNSLSGDGRRADPFFRPAYRWLMEQMSLRTKGYTGRFPIWFRAEKPDFQEVARDFQMIARRSLGLDAPA